MLLRNSVLRCLLDKTNVSLIRKGNTLLNIFLNNIDKGCYHSITCFRIAEYHKKKKNLFFFFPPPCPIKYALA